MRVLACEGYHERWLRGWTRSPANGVRLGFGVQGLRFGVRGLGFWVWDSRFGDKGLGFGVWVSGVRAQGSGVRDQGLGFRDQGLGVRARGGC